MAVAHRNINQIRGLKRRHQIRFFYQKTAVKNLLKSSPAQEVIDLISTFPMGDKITALGIGSAGWYLANEEPESILKIISDLPYGKQATPLLSGEAAEALCRKGHMLAVMDLLDSQPDITRAFIMQEKSLIEAICEMGGAERLAKLYASVEPLGSIIEIPLPPMPPVRPDSIRYWRQQVVAINPWWPIVAPPKL